jgi:hypothetical protein
MRPTFVKGKRASGGHGITVKQKWKVKIMTPLKEAKFTRIE